ncbi:MAG: alpha/beta fold hydrolase [Lentisphaerota bacterium]
MKRTIIMISGWAHPAKALRPLADRFRGQFEVILLSTLELSEYAESLTSLLRERSSPPLLLGWSMGGLIALQTALAAPDRVAGLILLSSTARFCSGAGYPPGTEERQVRGLSVAVRKSALAALTQFLQDAAHPTRIASKHLQTKLEHSLEFGADRLCQDLRYLIETDVREPIHQLVAPTLILHGREDRIIPAGASAWMHAHLPNSHLRLEDQTGHDLPLRHPDLVFAETMKYFEESGP